ncbi:hypothetical protein LNAOJCKE_4626 [Methylorubrum aminovorans]|uniref:Uncharacterized protein n=2 Tax=Methylorubrum TaxID=2282523 RepID=A0ABU9ZKF2_9HYPH|nr:hypothetical protein [Methylorubrum aminovorans]GJE67395.1 hypothetical protein LNAOJCKE_4626 [Methylorubrum aminovorans]GMA80198.1 hypothetical protein GCM10025880_66150 [Methylorubrum aminovorans]
MAPSSRLDLRRLARDAAAAPGSRREMRAPGGRLATGLMEAVRTNLDVLVALQAGGLTWDAVAAGLTAQGFTTADGQPVTGRNLTGIISSVRRQAAAREARMAARAARLDRPEPARALTDPSTPAPPPSRLAPELSRDHPPRRPNREVPAQAGSDAPLSEAEIRRLQAEKHSHLFKKD